MNNIYDVKLLDLIPPNLRNDPDIIAASAAIDKGFWSIANKAKNVLILSNFENLDSNVLDNLAWEFDVDFYDAKLDVNVKRNLIANSLKWKMKKGTPSAVEEMLSTVFDTSVIEEWFEYNGEPYMFKIRTLDVVDKEKYNQMKKVINTVKNSRSHLESFIIERKKELLLSTAVSFHIGKKLKISPRVRVQETDFNENIFHSISLYKHKKTEISPRTRIQEANINGNIYHSISLYRYKKIIIGKEN